MIKELIKLATHLDERGLVKEADYLDAVIKKLAVHGCESLGVALEVAKMKVNSCRKDYNTKCTGNLLEPMWTEGQFDQACMEAGIDLKIAIEEYEIADKNHKECVSSQDLSKSASRDDPRKDRYVLDDYCVKPGDNMYKITKNYSGGSATFKENIELNIAKYNEAGKEFDPNALSPGQKIDIWRNFYSSDSTFPPGHGPRDCA
jgi:hypothetical protein